MEKASELSEASNRLAENIFEDILKSIKSNDMEEKKTKKMTKAEAFEWLEGTKVVLRTEDDQLNLQKKLFDVGYKWLSSGTTLLKLYDVSCVFFLGIDGFIQHEEYEDEANKLFCDTHVYKPIKLRDILSIEIVEEKQCSEEDALDLISTVGARLSEVLRRMKGHKHIVITEDDVILYDEGMSLFHSDPF